MLSPTNPALSAHARSAPPRAWLIAIAVCALPLMAAWWLTIRMSVDFYAADNSGDQMFFTFGAIFMMWAVMMAAMMLPSVFPATLLFARLNHEWQKTGAFVFGYLSAWLVFSLARRRDSGGLCVGTAWTKTWPCHQTSRKARFWALPVFINLAHSKRRVCVGAPNR